MEWSFDQLQLKAINDLKKNLISKQSIFQFFNPSLPAKISTDSSKLRLGALIQQNGDNGWQAVAYASCATTQTEQTIVLLNENPSAYFSAANDFMKLFMGVILWLKMTTNLYHQSPKGQLQRLHHRYNVSC